MSSTNRTSADHLRLSAAKLLELIRKTDGLAPYLICRINPSEGTYLEHHVRIRLNWDLIDRLGGGPDGRSRDPGQAHG